jgi:hypothetical protein
MTMPELEIDRMPCIKINAPEWFDREDFKAFLNLREESGRTTATWHWQGAEPGEFSDVFFSYDHGEGSDWEVIPPDIWARICEIVNNERVVYALIWLTNLE